MYAQHSMLTVPLNLLLGVASLLATRMNCQSAVGVEPRPFANHVRFIPTGPITLDVLFEEGPFPPESGLPSPGHPPLPGWDENVVASISSAGGPPTLDETTLIATLPILDTLTSTAHDAMGNELGRIELLGVGNQKLDLSAENAVVDETAGTIGVQFGGPLLGGQPSADFSIVSATGIYASDVHVLDEGLFGYAGGLFFLPLDDDPDTSLQENILGAFMSGQIAGVDVVGVWTGQYVPEPSTGLLLAMAALTLVGWRRRR